MRKRLTPRELDVMSAVWRAGEATVAAVQDRLRDPLAYTTVLTVLRGLELKGYVGHRKEGRAFVYFPRVSADDAGAGLVERVLDRVFQGSPVRLLAHLVAERDLSREELERMRALLDERLGEEEGIGGEGESGSGGRAVDGRDRDDHGRGK
jgi:BlaI family transcriptional regulator, penicillinase repressor